MSSTVLKINGLQQVACYLPERLQDHQWVCDICHDSGLSLITGIIRLGDMLREVPPDSRGSVMLYLTEKYAEEIGQCLQRLLLQTGISFSRFYTDSSLSVCLEIDRIDRTAMSAYTETRMQRRPAALMPDRSLPDRPVSTERCMRLAAGHEAAAMDRISMLRNFEDCLNDALGAWTGAAGFSGSFRCEILENGSGIRYGRVS